jgi:phospholipase C
MPSPFKNLVVLMMENRSFDHMLGYLKTAQYQIDGLDGDETNLAADHETPIRVSPNARNTNDLTPDPSHEFQDITWQIYRNTTGEDTGQAKMQGFVEDYAADSKDAIHGAAVMRCFHEGSLPILSFLAKNFAVSDKWFSSLPASTIPNRLFAHAASSGGSLTQDAILAPATATTIFQSIIKDPNATCGIYTSGASILLANLFLMHHQDVFLDISTFAQDCRDNALPKYTFIEPIYDGVNASSQHPDFAVDKGEALIGQVYNAIRDSPMWEKTLLLIVYDEHGGLYDHVFPPTLVNDTGMPDLPPTKDFGFKFDRLGVRVPAVFVSPWLDAGTILPDQYEHCSIVKTIRQWFCQDQTPFTWREAKATSFSDLPVRDTMRTDKPDLPPVVTSDGNIPLPVSRDSVLVAADRGNFPTATGVVHTLAALAETTRTPDLPPVFSPAMRKPTDLVMLMAQAMEFSLKQVGITISKNTQQIFTAEDADAYLAEARAAVAQRGAQ